MIVKRIALLLLSWIIAGCSGANTPIPTKQPTLAPTQTPVRVQATLPPQVSAVLNGEILFNTFYEDVGFACATCHYTDSQNRLIGPGLLSLETRFAGYALDTEDVKAYIRESILEPQKFIVPEDPPYSANVMPREYRELFSDDELSYLVAYILSLRSGAS